MSRWTDSLIKVAGFFTYMAQRKTHFEIKRRSLFLLNKHILAANGRFCRDAAWAGRNGAAMRAGARMAEERTDAVSGVGRKNVFKLAGLLSDFLLVFHLKGLREQALRQPVPADDIFRAPTALFSKG